MYSTVQHVKREMYIIQTLRSRKSKLRKYLYSIFTLLCSNTEHLTYTTYKKRRRAICNQTYCKIYQVALIDLLYRMLCLCECSIRYNRAYFQGKRVGTRLQMIGTKMCQLSLGNQCICLCFSKKGFSTSAIYVQRYVGQLYIPQK